MQNNYIENRNDALRIISLHLSRFTNSTHKNLEILKLWIVYPENADCVAWADSNFVKELQSRLHQERIDAVKTIEVYEVSVEEMTHLLKSDPTIGIIKDNQIIYKTCSRSEARTETQMNAPRAWLVCIGGEDNVEYPVFELSAGKGKWNIGRTTKPSILEQNDIVIKDSCKDISRLHAAIQIDNGDYYLKCKEGGCRARGGRLTRIIRENGSQEDLISLHHKALAPLREGDIIQLSNSIYFKFTFERPEEEKNADFDADNDIYYQ